MVPQCGAGSETGLLSGYHIHRSYLDNVNGPVIDLLHVMSKYLNMGMPIEEVIYRTTKRPAEIIGHEELGDLKIGGEADIALLDIRKVILDLQTRDTHPCGGTKNWSAL
ncbi:MAG: hypothetical protein ACLUL2_12080 [Blautia sp.]